LHSDASYRFERGVDPDGVVRAADRAARLLAELAGGEVAPGLVEARGEPLPEPPRIALDPDRVNHLLGTELTRGEVAELLGRVDVEVEAGATGPLLCQTPRYRADLKIPEDLIEEVARIFGYDRIPATIPSGPFLGWTEPEPHAIGEALRDSLCQAGLDELMTFPAVPESDLDALRLHAEDPRRRLVRVVNPIQAGEPVLRSSLVPSVLRSLRLNLSRQMEDVRIFEIGRTFVPSKDGELPDESRQAVAALSQSGGEDLWQRSTAPVFFEAKGVAERVLHELGCAFEFRSGSAEPYLHPGASGAFHVGDQTIAEVGEIHPETAAAFDLEAPAAIVVFDADALLRTPRSPGRYREISRQPRARRDLAVLLDAQVQSGDVIEAIQKTAGSSLRSVSVFDRYEGKGVPEGKVSLAFRLEFQRTDRTLTDAEVGKAVDRVVSTLSDRFGGELR
jgi:phenylalanyl-tRNA synthetase beta chain